MNTSFCVLFVSASCILFSLCQGVGAATCEENTNATTCCSNAALNCSFYACYNESITVKPTPKCVSMNATLKTDCDAKNLTYLDQCAAVPTTTAAQTTVTIPTTTDTTSTTDKPIMTSGADKPTTTEQATTTPKMTTTKGSITTTAPAAHFDAGSFVGGLVLGCGLFLIGIFAFKFYKSRSGKNYHTL